jgi:copper chaperone
MGRSSRPLLDIAIVGRFRILSINRRTTMISFRIEDMTCGHCASTITQAVKAVDPQAQVRVDLGSHLVQIEPATGTAAALQAAIDEAGYTPVAV